MALKTLRCCGDASSPEQRSALRAIHPITSPKLYPLARGVVAHPYEASLRGLRPHLVCLGAISAGVGHGGEPHQIGKVLPESSRLGARRFSYCTDSHCVEFKEKRRKCADFLPHRIILDF